MEDAEKGPVHPLVVTLVIERDVGGAHSVPLHGAGATDVHGHGSNRRVMGA